MAQNGFCWVFGLPFFFSCDLWCSDSPMLPTSAFWWLLDWVECLLISSTHWFQSSSIDDWYLQLRVHTTLEGFYFWFRGALMANNYAGNRFCKACGLDFPWNSEYLDCNTCFSIHSDGGRGGIRPACVPGVHLRAVAASYIGVRGREYRVWAWWEGAQCGIQGEARCPAPHRRQALQPLCLAWPAPVPGIPAAFSFTLSNYVHLVGVIGSSLPGCLFWAL